MTAQIDAAVDTGAAESGDLAKSLAAESLIKTYVIGAISAGIVPLPLLDVAAVTAVQIRMIQKLSEHYGKPFSENLGRSIITSLAGGFLSFGGGALAGSLLKAVPAVGWALGMAAVPVAAGAATYAIGKVFMKHYEEGGSIFDLDPKKLKAYYDQQFRKGKSVAEDAHQAEGGAAGAGA